MKIRTLIVDDETLARERVKQFLIPLKEFEVIGEAKDGAEAVEMIEKKNPDLVILDIQMPELNGFEVLQMVDKPPLCIFVTAYDEYAINAFEINALDYLLKPFSEERFHKALQKASQILKEKKDFLPKLEQLFNTLTQRDHYLEKLGVKGGKKISIIDVEAIGWFQADRELVYAHVKGSRHIINCSLTQLEQRLNPEIFFRCHRSAIVNLSRIKEIIPWFSGSHRIILTDGTELPLSRSRVKQLKKIIQW
ncbi:MAG: LytR/AlgR family response regulator transcription factor [Candidatus Aminicenantia bacterium]